ncbi:glycosyltransferase family 4 protein [Oscillatoria salina IIICB1]|nr:glycosyltransferase family 4 protein [Oscillatoria salina IIICB1]
MRKRSVYILDKVTKRVFVFLEIFSQEGGIQSYIKDIFEAYRVLISKAEVNNPEDNYTAEVFLLRDEHGAENYFESENFKFHYLKTLPPWLGRLRLAIALLNCLLTQRPAHVYCGHINLASLVQKLCQPLGIPYTVLTYGKEVWEPLSPKKQQALAQAAAIWTISRYSQDRLCAANKINPQKVRMLPCVVDGNKFTPGEKPYNLIAKYNLADAKVLMTVARLWSGDIYKGVDVTIRALPKILAVFPEVKYLAIGRGDDRPRLAQLARDLDVAEKVVFAGFVPKEELVAHYRVADAYIMPSQEGFGIVYLEAMACGKPVLSGDADGSADPLQNGCLGWRVPHRDAEAVAAATIEILKGKDRRCDGEWLREQTLAKFGKEALQKRLQDLLEKEQS